MGLSGWQPQVPIRVGAYAEGQWYNPEPGFMPTQPMAEPFRGAFGAGQNMWGQQPGAGCPAQWGYSFYRGR
jgi:hypothetical protein